MRDGTKKRFPWIKVCAVAVCLVAIATFLMIKWGGRREEVLPTPATSNSEQPAETAVGHVQEVSDAPSPAPQTSAAEPAPDLPAISADDMLADMVDDTASAADRNLPQSSDLTAWVHKYLAEHWEEQDEVFESMPRYEDVRDEYRKLAEDRLAGIDLEDTQTIISLAAAERESFWDIGALAEPDAYEHAFLACAILELAVERSPDDFALLGELKESLASISPLHKAHTGFYMDSIDRLWPVVEKQHELIMSGKVQVSPEAMTAVYDWVQLVPFKKMKLRAGLPGYQWLIDNAEDGGWHRLKSRFENEQKLLDGGAPPLPGFSRLYQTTGTQDEILAPSWLEHALYIRVKYERRLPSLRGSKEAREVRKPEWEIDR